MFQVKFVASVPFFECEAGAPIVGVILFLGFDCSCVDKSFGQAFSINRTRVSCAVTSWLYKFFAFCDFDVMTSDVASYVSSAAV